MKTPKEHQTNILDKLKALRGYVDRLSTTLEQADLTKPDDDIQKIESEILMIQGQKEFVKQAIQEMEKSCKI